MLVPSTLLIGGVIEETGASPPHPQSAPQRVKCVLPKSKAAASREGEGRTSADRNTHGSSLPSPRERDRDSDKVAVKSRLRFCRPFPENLRALPSKHDLRPPWISPNNLIIPSAVVILDHCSPKRDCASRLYSSLFPSAYYTPRHLSVFVAATPTAVNKTFPSAQQPPPVLSRRKIPPSSVLSQRQPS